MKDLRLLVPIFMALVLVPIFIAGLVIYNPGGECDCNCTDALALVAHSHGAGLTTDIIHDMQLIFNVSPGAQLYQVVDGRLELCSGDLDDPALKHVTVDVNDARLVLGERLPVMVQIEIREADSGSIVVQADAPAMYSPGHGYHFGDNFNLPNDVRYDWTVSVSPVWALRQAGAQDYWLEPVTWEGSFTLDADGNPVDKASGPQLVGEVTHQGIHIMLSATEPQMLYDVTPEGAVAAADAEPGSTYFVVDVTDHIVNYEEKLLDALVMVTFEQRTAGESREIRVPFVPVISPVYGYHYGANVTLAPGAWTVRVEVSKLDFLRHAGPAVSLARGTVSGTFDYVVSTD